jgi:hypothetical protein
MGEVVITFVGICTHIGKVRLTPPPDAVTLKMMSRENEPEPVPGSFTRVVLPDASLGCRLGGQVIPPHEAVLRIPNRFVVSTSDCLPGLEEVHLDPGAYTWLMKGVQLYAAEATENLMDETDSYLNLPGLTDVAGVLSLELDPRVVLHGRASAVVDLYAGTRDAYCDPNSGEAVVGKFTVQTKSQRLAVVRMRDGERGFIELQDDAAGQPPVVFVMNTGGGQADKALDFLLHYYVTTWTPGEVPVPKGRPCSGVREANEVEILLHKELVEGLTFGCSNSNYP